MEDKMNRQLTCPISPDDSAVALSHELVHLGFIHEVSMIFIIIVNKFLKSSVF